MSDHFSDEPERMTTSETGGNKAEKDLQLGALDPRALMEVARVAGVGAKKYARYNFAKGYAWSLSYDACQRHLHAFWDNVDRDKATGLYHTAQAAWHCLTLLTFQIRGLGTDDRFGFPSPEEKPQAPQAERDQAWLVVQTEAERKERLRVLSEMGRDELLAVIRGFENL